MDFEKVDLQLSDIEKIEEKPTKPKTREEVCVAINKLKDKIAVKRLENKAKTSFSRALIEKCLIIGKHTFVIRINNIGIFRVYETGEDIFSGNINGQNFLISDTISLQHLEIFWKTFYEFIEIAKGVGLEVSVSEKFTHNNSSLISFYIEKL